MLFIKFFCKENGLSSKQSKFDSNYIFVDPRTFVFDVNFYIYSSKFLLETVVVSFKQAVLPSFLSHFTSTIKSFLSSNVAFLKSLLITIFCPFNWLTFWNIFVLSLNRNNFMTIVQDLLVLLSLLLCFPLCACSISIPSNPNFCANLSWTFSSQSFHVFFFVSFIPSILILSRRNLSSNSANLFWTYFRSIWYS